MIQELGSLYGVSAMPDRGVFSSGLASFQGPFGGREGGAPENVENNTALEAKQSKTRHDMQGHRQNGLAE
jgi:hypothetical protein